MSTKTREESEPVSVCDVCKTDDVELPASLVSQGKNVAPLHISHFTFCLDGLTRCDACFEKYSSHPTNLRPAKRAA